MSNEQPSSNPWATTAETSEPANPWAPPADDATVDANPWGSSPATDQPSTDWLTDSAADVVEPAFDLLDPFQEAVIPLGAWVDQGLEWLVMNFRGVFQAIRWPIDATLTGIESALLAVPDILMLAIIGLLAWQASSIRLGIGAVISMAVVGLIGAWSEAMVTLSLVLTSVFFCMVIG